MAYHWSDLVGNLGVAMIVLAYLAMQIGRLDGRGMAFSALNAAGAAFILVSLYYDFNLSAFIIEVFWIAISMIGIVRALRGSNRQARPDGTV